MRNCQYLGNGERYSEAGTIVENACRTWDLIVFKFILRKFAALCPVTKAQHAPRANMDEI